MYRSRQGGFTAVETILIVATVTVIAFVGWRLYEVYGPQQQHQATTETPVAETDETPAIRNSDDLQGAEDYLHETDIDGELDTNEIDATFEE